MNIGAAAPVIRTTAMLILLWSCTAAPLAAADIPAAPLPVAITQAAPGLQLSGSGTYRWFGLQIYDATLWLPPTSASQATQPDWSRPLVLQLRYARTLRGADIAQRSVAEIEKLGLATAAQQQSWLAAMRALFPDVSDGSTLTGIHLPGRGARFFHNGQPVGDIDDAAFSRAFFSIWLNPGSSAPALRAALLGLRP